MSLKNIPMRPGIMSDDTDRGVGKDLFWKDGDKVRFYDGLPQKLGGWQKTGNQAVTGKVRGITDWRAIDTSARYIAAGSHLKLWLNSGGYWFDITPLRDSGSLTNPFSTTINQPTVVVDDTAHGLFVGDYVSFSGASAVGGITVSGEYTITEVVNANQYKITHASNASSTSGPGGGTVAYAYQIHIGSEDAISGLGWGAGTWGGGTWGTARTVTDFLSILRTWSMDNWGQDLIANPRQGGIYTWVTSGGTGTRATAISGSPEAALSVFVSQESRHMVALGAHDGVALDPLLIRWCSQEDYTDWVPTLANTAGDKRLDGGNEIYCGLKVRGEHLIYTDSHLFSMQYVGPDDIFAFRPLGDNGGLRGPNAAIANEGVAYWIGEKEFFIYDGVTRTLDCTVNSKVFDDINTEQNFKIWAGINRKYSEVWWLYPSANSTEVDRYVIYNYESRLWYYGTLDRTVLLGNSDVFASPYAVGTDGWLYDHEYGVDADGAAMAAFLKSGDVEIDDAGEQIAHVGKYIPDFKRLSGTVNVSFVGKKYPQASETQSSGPHAITSSTQFANPRMRCRQISIQLETSQVGDDFRMGQLRIGILPHGKR